MHFIGNPGLRTPNIKRPLLAGALSVAANLIGDPAQALTASAFSRTGTKTDRR